LSSRFLDRISIKLVDALIAADKDFDMLIMPGRNHGFGNERYFTRRRWDYFVTHLMGETPPTAQPPLVAR
jgi:dipeptidyl-peptidase-4